MSDAAKSRSKRPAGKSHGREEEMPEWVQKCLYSLILERQRYSVRERAKILEEIDCLFEDWGLHPFQKEGVEFVLSRRGKCIIGDEMGLGKTAQAIATAWYYRRKYDGDIISTTTTDKISTNKGDAASGKDDTSNRGNNNPKTSEEGRVVSKSNLSNIERSDHGRNEKKPDIDASPSVSSGNKTMPCNPWPVLVVSPASVQWTWKAEIERWLNARHKKQYGRDIICQVIRSGKDNLPEKKDVDFVIISYDLLKNAHFQWFDLGNNIPFQMMIVDEAHKIKERTAQRTVAVMEVSKRAKHCLLLSGTICLNRAAELYTVLDLMLAEEVAPSFEEFKQRYCKQGKKLAVQNAQKGQLVSKEAELFDARGSKKHEELHEILKHVMIRRLKKNVLTQLPAKTRQKIPIPRAELARCINRSSVKKATKKDQDSAKTTADESDDVDDTNIVKNKDEKSIKLDDIFFRANENASLLSLMAKATSAQAILNLLSDVGNSKTPIATRYRKTGEAKLPFMKEYVLTMLEKGLKFLLFYHHKVVGDEMEKILQKNSTGNNNISNDSNSAGYIRIDGSTKKEDRAALVSKFQEDPGTKVALLSIMAAGEGLTLTAASIAVFLELYWVSGLLEQAEDRCHRIGQPNAVICQYLCAEDTVDDLIYNLLEQKKSDTSKIMDGVARNMAFEVVEGDLEQRQGDLLENNCQKQEAGLKNAIDKTKKDHVGKSSNTKSSRKSAKNTKRDSTALKNMDKNVKSDSSALLGGCCGAEAVSISTGDVWSNERKSGRSSSTEEADRTEHRKSSGGAEEKNLEQIDASNDLTRRRSSIKGENNKKKHQDQGLIRSSLAAVADFFACRLSNFPRW